MRATQLLKGLYNPARSLSELWRRFPVGPFWLRLACDAVPRPHYAYCMFEAALLARRLGIDEISVIEFGVAGGNGLVAMERLAAMIERHIPARFQIYGFDMGTGLPRPQDYRDLPYVYSGGSYAMDEPLLRQRLHRAELVIGDVAQTVPTFFTKHSPAPLGFVAIDLDYYSATVEALKLFDAPHEQLLPRVFCYLDDVVGLDWAIHNEWVGELAAVKDFNEAHPTRKIAPVHGLRHKRAIPSAWNDAVYAFHDFEHPLYNTYVVPVPTRHLALRGSRGKSVAAGI